MPTNELALSHAFKLELDFDTPVLVPSASGERGFFKIASSRISGERVKGEVADDGGDWFVFRPDGVVEFDTRMMIRTDDDTMIYLRSRGVLRAAPDQLAAFQAGEGFNGADLYYRTTPYFDAPVGPYDWLTKSIFVGEGQFSGNSASLDVFEVL